MQNYKLRHTLPGHDKELFVCSCGHQSFHDTATSSIACPDCGEDTPLFIGTFNELRFGEVSFEKHVIYFKEDKDKLLYKFDIDIFLIKNAYKMNFGTKKMKLLDEKYSDYTKYHYRISFNGHAYNEPMVKIINVLEPDKEYNDALLKRELGKLVNEFRNYSDYRIRNMHLKNAGYMNSLNRHDEADVYMTVSRILRDLKDVEDYCKQYEKLIKIGLDPHDLNGELIQTGRTPAEILNLTPHAVKILKEIGGNKHRALQIIEKNFKEQSNNYINTFAKIDNYDTHNATRLSRLVNEARLSIPKLYKFLYKDAPMQQGLYNTNETLTLLFDSYNLAKDLGLPFDKNPKALKRYHDTLVKEHAVIADKKKNELFANITNENKYLEYRPDDKVIMPEEGSEGEPQVIAPEFFIKLPVDAQDLIREGKIMRHCVASYVDRVIRRDTMIFFLRRTVTPDEPYCTIEVSPDTLTVRQVKGKGNKKITDIVANKTIREWCKKRNITWNGTW